MSILSIYTKRHNLAESPAVRRWGLPGARRFWLGWAAFMYAMLTLVTGYGFSLLAPNDRAVRIVIYIAAALIVLAASLLTRMLMRVLAELRGPESPARRDRDPK